MRRLYSLSEDLDVAAGDWEDHMDEDMSPSFLVFGFDRRV